MLLGVGMIWGHSWTVIALCRAGSEMRDSFMSESPAHSGSRIRGLACWFPRQPWTCPILVFYCLSSPFSKDRVRVKEASSSFCCSCVFQQLQNVGKTPLLSKDRRELLLGYVCLRRCILCCTFLLKAFTLMYSSVYTDQQPGQRMGWGHSPA